MSKRHYFLVVMTQKVTITKAREILGKKAENMSDKQVQNILDLLYALSTRALANDN